VVVNNWEATYFDFDEQKILTLAGQAKKLGIDMIVMDDGWFGKRNDDKTSLGDWYENKEKLPGGLAELSQKVKQKGVAFGLWFEPEMVSPDSDLYRAHPDWCLQIKGRRQTLGRNQLLLDMSRGDVCDYLIERISDILRNVSIDYVKWDFNRNLTEVYSQTLPPERQGEVYHRFMLGTYYVLQKLNEAFLDVLFEGCSGGGGRFDPGMLYYSPQIWTSDDTDAVERIKIQYGTSLVYPMSAISSHVSAVPNHQTGRITPFDFRGDVAMTGAFGYELDLAKLTARECELVEKQIADYKRYCAIITGGRLYRLRSPFGANDAAWMVVSRDKCEALVSYFSFSAQPNAYMDTLPLEGLQGDFIYRDEQGNEYSGLQLMNFGIILPEIHGQYTSRLWHFKAIN
jgi:alpha-galactosidase